MVSDVITRCQLYIHICILPNYCLSWEAYFVCAVHLKIEEIGRMLRTGDLGIPTNPTERYMYIFVCLYMDISALV